MAIAAAGASVTWQLCIMAQLTPLMPGMCTVDYHICKVMCV